MKKKTAMLVLLTVIAAASGVVIASHLSNSVPVSGTIPIGTQSGTTVYVEDTGGELNLEDPWVNETALYLRTEAGNATVVANSSGPAEVTLSQITGQQTVISDADVSQTRVRVDPEDKASIAIEGDVTRVALEDSVTLDDGDPDIEYSADGPATIEVGGLPTDTAVGVVNQSSGRLLATDRTDINGRAEFRDLPAGSADLLIQESPQSLFIREEPNSNSKVSDVSVEIRFFTQNSAQIETRSTTNGQIEMDGLPKNESFVVTAEADGFRNRRVYVNNLFEQQSVYLLNESDPAVTKVFEYSDFSGSFAEDETVLKIQRPVDGEWKTMQGDVIGATGEYRVDLAQNERHRLVLLNTETGDRRVQGAYTPVTDGQQEISIYADNSIEVTAVGPRLSFTPQIGVVPAAETTFEVDVQERDSPIDSATVTVFERTDSGLTELSQKSVSSSTTVSQTANFTGKADSSAVVRVQYQLTDGSSGERYQNYSIREQYQNPNSVLSALTGFPQLLPDGNAEAFQNVVALLTSVMVAGAAASRARISGTGFGVIVTGTLAGWSVIGWVGYGIVFASGAALGALVFLRRGF